MIGRPLLLLAAGLLLAAAAALRPALADEREGSLHVEIGPAVLRAEDPQDAGATAVAPAGRLSVRLSYGLGDHHALEVGAGAVTTRSLEFPDQSVDGFPGTLAANETALRATAGLTARLGVRWIPTVTGQVGFQHRFLTGCALYNPATSSSFRFLPDRGVSDVLAIVGVGLDYRFGRHWIAGLSVQAVHAFSLDGNSYDALEIPLHVAFYDYPSRWGRR